MDIDIADIARIIEKTKIDKEFSPSISKIIKNIIETFEDMGAKDNEVVKQSVKKEKSKKKIPHIDSIDCYTDGSLRPSGHGQLCGYGIHFATPEIQKYVQDVAEPFTFGEITNNRAELYAILQTIQLVSEKVTFDHLNIYTDSEYSQKSLTVWIKSWKAKNWKNSKNKDVENQDLIKSIDELMEKYDGKINIEWVRAHTGNSDKHSIGNAEADRLANMGGMNS